MSKKPKMLVMSDDEYNKLNGYRSTDFKEIAKYGLYDHLYPPARIDKPAFAFGSMFHCMVLEPEKFDAQYAPMFESDLNKNTNLYKEQKAEFEKANAGKEIVSREDYDLASNMRDTVMLRYGNILEKSVREIVMTHTTDDGIALKAKIDCFSEEYGLIFDLKSTGDSIDRNNTQWNSEKFLYQLQAAFYETVVHGNGINTNQFAFLFASKADYRALMYKADGFFMERGRDKLAEIYAKVLKYKTDGIIDDAVMDLSVPAAVLNREQGAA